MATTERTLIVGIDYSDFCIPALDQALRMAAESPAIRLVPLLALPEATPSRLEEVEASTDDFTARARDNLVRLLQTRSKALGVPLGPLLPVVCFGKPADCLLKQARELNASLILVGTHSRRGLGHLLVGSVAEEVVRKAPCSVLVARPEPERPSTPVRAAPPAAKNEAQFSEAQFLEVDVDLAPSHAFGADHGVELLAEPHLDAGRVVLHVLEIESGQTFVCSFSDFSGVEVQPLEGQWVPHPSGEARARVARFALAEAGRNAPRFTELFQELNRRTQSS
jgi:nucleotide-binding universal stress UspA family protein